LKFSSRLLKVNNRKACLLRQVADTAGKHYQISVRFTVNNYRFMDNPVI
jgi:hypothetical protein